MTTLDEIRADREGLLEAFRQITGGRISIAIFNFVFRDREPDDLTFDIWAAEGVLGCAV